MDIKGWVKAHPYATGALVIGGGLTFILLSGWFSGGGNSTVAVSSPGVSDAQLAAQTQVQLAQIAAGASNAQTGAELKAAELAAGLQATIAKLTSDATMYSINADREVNLASLGAQTSYNAQNIAAQTQMFTIQNQTALEMAKLDALVNTSNTNASREVSLAQISSNNQIQTAQITANTTTTQAIIEALKPQTPTVTAPVVTPPKYTSVWDAVLADRPDVMAAWTSTAQYNTKYAGDEEAWVADWYTQWGAASGYQLPQV